MKKVSIWTWLAPIAAVLLILGCFTGGFTSDLGQRMDHTGMVKVEYQLYPVGSGWGFDILIDKKKIIHQDRIPAVNGRRPFASKEDAEKVGRLMIDKLEKGIFPPWSPSRSCKTMESQ